MSARFSLCASTAVAVCAALCLFGQADATTASAWKAVATVPGGNVSSVVFDTKQPGMAFAGSTNGIIYRSADGGASWAPVKVGAAADDFRTVAVSPAAGSVVYAVSTNTNIGGAVYVSQNEGISWAPLPSQPSAIAPYGALGTVRGLAVDPTGQIIVFTDASQGIFRSADAGATWSLALPNSPVSGTHGLAVDAVSPSTLWAAGRVATGTGTIAALYKSTDFGATWSSTMVNNLSAFTTSDGWGIAVQPSTDTIIMWYQGMLNGVITAGLVRTTDGGTKFTTLTRGLPSDFAGDNSAAGIVFDPAKPTNVLLGNNGVVGPDGLLLSTNSGTSWASIGNSLPTGLGFTLAARPAMAGYSAALFAGSPGLFLSTDHATSWASSQAGLANSMLNNVANDGLTGTGYYACGPDGVFHTTNAGKAWARIGTWAGVQYCAGMAVDLHSPTHSLYATTGLAVWRTDSTGTNWVNASPALATGQTITSLQADPAVSGRLYAEISTAAGGAVLLITNNQGANWSSVTVGTSTDSFTGPLAIAKKPAGLLYAALPSGLWASTNAGNNWAESTSTLPGQFTALAVETKSPYLLVAGGYVTTPQYQGAVWTSANKGGSFTASTGYAISNLGIPGSFVTPPSGAEVAVVDSDGLVHLSKTGGTLWATETLPAGIGGYSTLAATTKSLFLSDSAGNLYSALYTDLQ